MAAFNLFLEKKSLKKKNKKKLYLNNLFQSKARASLHLTPPPPAKNNLYATKQLSFSK